MNDGTMPVSPQARATKRRIASSLLKFVSRRTVFATSAERSSKTLTSAPRKP